MPTSPATVLYVDDDADDVFFLRRALQVQNVACQLQAVSSVTAAKSYLSGKAPYNDRVRFPMPALIVTDMTIPGVEGSSKDLISWIRSTSEIAKLPILCATGNDQPSIRDDFARLGVTCHQKSTHMIGIAEAIKSALGELLK
jgi:CheY-like chemotaxis protein